MIPNKDEAISTVQWAIKSTNELLEKDEGIIAKNTVEDLIRKFNKWGYNDLIPKLTSQLEKIKEYIIKCNIIIFPFIIFFPKCG